MKIKFIAVIILILVKASFNLSAATSIGEIYEINIMKQEAFILINDRMQELNKGDKLAVIINNKIVPISVSYSMGTTVICRLFIEDADKLKYLNKGMPVYQYDQQIESELINGNSEDDSERQIVLNYYPKDAQAYIDGKIMENKTSEPIKLAPKESNEYSIKVKKWGYNSINESISVKQGESKNLFYSLNKDYKYYVIVDALSVGLNYIDNDFEWLVNVFKVDISLNYWGFGFTIVKINEHQTSIVPVELFYPVFDIDFKKVPVLFSVNYEFDWCHISKNDHDAYEWGFVPEHIFKLNCYFGTKSEPGKFSFLSSIYAAYSITPEERKYYVGATIGLGGMTPLI